VALALVINSGSSSLKYQLIELDDQSTVASGLIERIGEAGSTMRHSSNGETHDRSATIPDHTEALRIVRDSFASFGPDIEANPPVVVGHRVVHGGAHFGAATVVTPKVEADIDELSALAPLHNPAALAGIRAAEEIFAGVPQVVVFDTAFHQTLPAEAYTYAIDRELAEKYQVRRYGFHGTSHKYVSEQAAVFLGKPLESLKMIVLHLGNGASATAIDGGRSVDTSMGLTPLEGLMMGTRSGDLDPAVVVHLHRAAGMTVDEIDVLLNRRSGFLGLAGASDMRDVEAAAEAGDEAALAALAVWRHRIQHYLGAYIALLGGVDAVVFTAGVGENSPLMRGLAIDGLEFLGLQVDPERNDVRSRQPRAISPDGAPVAVLIIPTNEELEIARQSMAAIGR
jgi:acetate kinase